jgi:HK97 family phage prohead protease
MEEKWDFKGWATRYNVRCSDERIILEGAFANNDKQEVPLVWNHRHNDAENVIGHALLENRKEGVYAYGKFNDDTASGRHVKALVRNRDVTALSIFANQLKEVNRNVTHGNIRELSVVLAGANPGAYIEAVLSHSDTGINIVDEALIYNNGEIEILHSDDKKYFKAKILGQDGKTESVICYEAIDEESAISKVLDGADIPEENLLEISEVSKEVFDTWKKEEESKKVLPGNNNPIDTPDPNKEGTKKMDKTIGDVYNTLNEEQKLMVAAFVAAALEEAETNGGDTTVKHNAFETPDPNDKNFLQHTEFVTIFKEASSKGGSLKDTFIAHSITDIDVLFPEARGVNQVPELIARQMLWVSKVMNGVYKTPFSKIKNTWVNMTADDARAKGYVKGNRKAEEVIAAYKRSTVPTTIYKFQKLDRDDIIDITDFDVVVFLKAEMRVMLDEELARAILIGDGRPSGSDDKVDPTKIRPIYGDDPLYTIVSTLAPAAEATASQKAKALIDEIIRSRTEYKGSGNPSLFIADKELVEMLLIEDTNGRKIYKDINELEATLLVDEIVRVPVMEGVRRTVEGFNYDLKAILVDLRDYNVGTNKGGEVSFFDDFDLNFNKMEYLLETRCSGALKRPLSAIVYELKSAVVVQG